MRSVTPLLLLTLTVVATSAGAQGMLLDGDTHAMGVTGAVSTSDHVDGATAGFAFSYAGRLDVEVDYVSQSYDGYDRSGYLAPVITAHVMKESDARPLSAAVRVGWGQTDYTYDERPGARSVDDETLSFGTFVYRTLESSPRLRVIPEFGVRFDSQSVRYQDRFGRPRSSSTSGLSFVGGVTFAVRVGARAHLAPHIGLEVDDDQNTTLRARAGIFHEIPAR